MGHTWAVAAILVLWAVIVMLAIEEHNRKQSITPAPPERPPEFQDSISGTYTNNAGDPILILDPRFGK